MVNERTRQALEAIGEDTKVESSRQLGAGHGQDVVWVELGGGDSVVVKSVAVAESERIKAEADGLRALKEMRHLLVPDVRGVVEVDGSCVLVMDGLEAATASDDDWARFGEELALHHGDWKGEQYGWERDNFIGATNQVNGWWDDWVEFNGERRIGYQVELAVSSGKVSGRDEELLRRVIERMGDFLPRKPRPALLHGDLWSGNALAARTKDGVRIGVIDPAVYVGDAWADIAMMRMFGGFPPSCLDSYHAATNDTDGVEERVLVYQLYHMLNHLNLFGGGYKGSALGIAHRLVGR